MNYNWKIGGEAGVGIMTSGLSITKLASRLGYHAFGYSEYPSLIKGGHNTFEVAISTKEQVNSINAVNMLVCLDKLTYDLHKDRLTNESIVVYDSDDFENELPNVINVKLPLSRIARSLGLFAFAKNTTAVAVSAALMGVNKEYIYQIIEENFGSKKGEEVVKINKQLADEGFRIIETEYNNFIKQIVPKIESEEKIVATGNDLFSLASVDSDLRFYAAYPMTPSSSVLATLASFSTKSDTLVVRHAEDEIAVIAEALGASFTGVRSSVGTSGGGFALMVEHISFAGVAELPIVVYLGMRPGPATGMPTWTEQGELLFASIPGHGEFPRIVLFPGDAYEMVELTKKAYNLADKYQTPVIILADKYVCESYFTLPVTKFHEALSKNPISYGDRIKNVEEGYKRYELTTNGISKMVSAGSKNGFWQANSYSHLEDSHTTENGNERKKQVDKLIKKEQTYLQEDFALPNYYGNAEANIVFITAGSSKSMIINAVNKLNDNGAKIGILHFTHIYPLNVQKIKEQFKENVRYIIVENNATGQFKQLLRMQTGIDIQETYLRYDGRPISTDQIVSYIQSII